MRQQAPEKVDREFIGGPCDGSFFEMDPTISKAIVPVLGDTGFGQFIYRVGADGDLYPDDEGGQQHSEGRAKR